MYNKLLSQPRVVGKTFDRDMLFLMVVIIAGLMLIAYWLVHNGHSIETNTGSLESLLKGQGVSHENQGTTIALLEDIREELHKLNNNT